MFKRKMFVPYSGKQKNYKTVEPLSMFLAFVSFQIYKNLLLLNRVRFSYGGLTQRFTDFHYFIKHNFEILFLNLLWGGSQ